MKKCFSLCLSMLLLVSALGTASFAADGWTASTNPVDLRVGILGDTHTRNSEGATFDWFKKNVKAILDVGANKLDGFALTGDVIYYEESLAERNYDAVLSVLNGTHTDFASSGIKDLPKVYAMGNHEYPLLEKDETKLASARQQFTQATGCQLRNTATMGAGNYHFIAAAADNYYGKVSAETESWLKQQIDAALAQDSTNAAGGAFADGVIPNSTKPVFVALHHYISNTIFNIADSNYSEDFVTYLKSRPQVIVLTGHMHIAAQIPATIWQDGFTVFQTSHSAGGTLYPWECDNEKEAEDVHQGSMIEVKDNVVKLYKLDISTNEYIGEPWVIDIPAIVADRTNSDPSDDNNHYLYSADKRANPNAPSFPESAALDVAVDGCSVSVQWPNTAIAGQETPNQQDDFVRGYKVEICGSDGNVIAKKQYENDYYYPATKHAAYSCDFGLGFNTAYTAKVYPMGGLGSYGEPLTASFTTGGNTAPTGAIRYEAEAYAESNITENSMASGGKLVGSMETASTSTTITIPITVDEDGYYDLSYAMGQQTTQDVSKITVKIDGTELGTNGTGYAANISNLETFPWKYTPMRLYKNKAYRLTGGGHTVTIEVDGVASAGGNRKYYVDYFQIQFPEDRVVTGDAPMVLEFEDFYPEANKKANSGASGGAIASSSWTQAECDLNIPILVEDAGYYDIEFVIGFTSNVQSYPQINVSLGSIGLGNNLAATAYDETFDASVYTDYYTDMPLRRYKYPSNWLEAGTVSLVLDFLGNDPKKYNLDYFKVTPTEGKRKVISAAESTTIEFEEGVSGATVDAQYGGSNGGLISSGWTTRSKIEIPISVKQSGYYDVEYVLGALKSGTDHSKWDLYLDDVLLGSYSNSDTIGGNTVPDGYKDVWTANSIRKFRENRIWIDKGNYLIKLVLQKTGNGTGDHYTYVADYIKFTPHAAPTVSKAGITTIEFEDYTANNSHVMEDSYASGGKFISHAYSYTNQSRDYKVIVEEGGEYDFEVAMGYSFSVDSYPLNTVSVNGSYVFYSNSYSQYEDLTDKYTNYNTNIGNAKPMGMRRYKARVQLNAGVNVISVNMRLEGGSVCKFNMDYMKLTPVESINVEGSKITVTGVYDQALSGTAILALYNGEKLVRTQTADVENTAAENTVVKNATVVKIPVAKPEQCDKAKLFFWSDTSGLKPLTAAKPFEIQ